jgi:hypothetical protein
LQQSSQFRQLLAFLTDKFDRFRLLLEEAMGELCPVQKYVREELQAYLGCSIYHEGFLRVRCPKDARVFEHDTPFGCKKTGFCSSCFA